MRERSDACCHACASVRPARRVALQGSAGLWSNDFKVLTALRPFSARGVIPAACPAVQAFDRFNGRTSGTRTLGAMPNEGIHGRKQEPGQRSPRDGGWEADRLTATSRGDDSPMPMSIRGTPDSCVAFGGPCPDTVYRDAHSQLATCNPQPPAESHVKPKVS